MKKKNLIHSGLATLAALTLIACGSGTGSEGDEDLTDAGTDQSITATEADPTPPKAAKLNTPVRDGKFEFKVTSMKCNVDSVGRSFLKKKAQGDFCLVNLTVKNIGNEPQMFFDANQFGFIGSTKYNANSEASIVHAGDNPSWISDINPGNQITATLVFDTPSDKKLSSVELHDSALSGGVTVKVS